MKTRFIIIISLVLAINSWHITAQDDHKYVLKKEFVEMDDGIKLATDIYLPDNNERYPVILVRTPYNKDGFKKGAEKFTEQGYVVVLQDCRGKFNSEGEFYAFKNERTDGLETIEWIKSQPWGNGKIAGYGSSYNGYTQWAISDHLDAVIAEMTGADLYDLVYPEGLFSLETACNWGLIVDAKYANPIPPEKLLKSYWYLPLSIADDSTFKDNQFINDWMLHENNDDYWKSMNHQGIAKGPVLSIGGWYDIFLLAQINDFIEMDRKNNHPGNKIIIGPWCHGPQAFKNEYGGSGNTGRRGPLQERFLARHILGNTEEVLEPPFTNKKYNLFIMERNKYYGSDEWPPKDVTKTDYFLDKNKISLEKPSKSNQLEFVYNPENPYPSLGGTALGIAVGPAVQNKSVDRTDQLVFETGVLDNPMILLGSVSATLFVNSKSDETDFMILVQDVFPNDTIINIMEGGKSVNIKNKKVNKIELESWPTGYQLNPGHNLRIVITSSWFPRFNRNLNKGEAIFKAKEMEPATQTLYLGKKYSSKVCLPILNIN